VIERRWSVASPNPEMVTRLTEALPCDRLVATLLVNRGVTDPDEARYFLNPPLDGMHDPFLMSGMKEATTRIATALEQGEPMVVYGDYDVDGVSATAILIRFLREVGGMVSYYLPERESEGYGLNCDAVDQIAEGGAKVLITVDNGITAVEEVAHAARQGLDVIVTDHHHPPEQLPRPYALLNPKLPQCGYPFSHLSGGGIAFKLCVGVRRELAERGRSRESLPNLKKLLDLAALATVADMVPLVGENRIIVTHGLPVLANSDKRGVKALKRVAGIAGGLDAASVAFGLGPRLNCAGRLGRADTPLDLLITDDDRKATELAQFLDDANQRRKEVQKHIFESAIAMAAERDVRADRALPLASETWKQGVVGVVASKLVERYAVPTLLVAFNGDKGRGSARSIPGFHLAEALDEVGDLLEAHGGHAMAAGFTIRKENFGRFQRRFIEVARAQLSPEDLQPVITIDGEDDPNRFDLGLLRQINSCAPFGEGNRKPCFVAYNLRFADIRTMGANEEHLRIRPVGGKGYPLIGFGFADKVRDAGLSGTYDVVFEPTIDQWQGRERVQLLIRDMRRGEGDARK